MRRNWDEFQGSENKFRREDPHVTLSPKGVILMNRIAHQMFGEPSSVRLRYDRSNDSIALKPSDGTAHNDFSVKGKSGINRVIHASPFCRHHRIMVDRTMVFNVVNVEDDMLVLECGSMTAVGMGGRGA